MNTLKNKLNLEIEKMMEEILNNTLTFVIGLFLPSVILVLLISKIGNKMNKSKKIPYVISERNNFEEIAQGISSSVSLLYSNGIQIPDSVSHADALAKATIEELKNLNIMTITDLVNNDIVKIINEVTEALSDSKINYNDIGEGIAIGSILGKMAKKLDAMKKELKDLTWDEVDIIIITALRTARKLGGVQ